MKFYKIEDRKLNITDSSFNLPSPWVGYEVGEEPKELKDALQVQQDEVEALMNTPKKIGEIYTLNDMDYKVSFMKDDGDGMMQVNMAFQLGLTETVIHFENGTKMPIKNTEFESFAKWFIEKRNSFFI